MNTLPIEFDLSQEIQLVFDKQRQYAPQMALTTAADRIERLNRIETWVHDHEQAIFKALYDDFRKPPAEVLLGDLGILLHEISYIRKHLRQWMRPQRVATPLPLIGTRSHVHHEPKGNVLIIAPWNYPFGLVLKPLVSAIAAGNVAILKPSEMTPHTTTLLQRMIRELFPREEVALFDGGAEVSQALLDLPFNHIFFTGSPAIGKIVMAAAARHLTSVTLELGGKSPVIIDDTVNPKTAARQVAWAKCFNNGQTCIAPDYVLIHESKKEAFLSAFQDAVRAMYSPDGKPIKESGSYNRIINHRHFQRVTGLISEAVTRGARIRIGGQTDAADRFLEPTVLDNLTDDMAIMQEEIFGPVLPVLTFTHLDEALLRIRNREKPLALYIQSRSQRNIDYIMARTTAGDTVINDLMSQIAQTSLPFGGVNNSGIGKSNGIYGFQEFSNLRGVVRREYGTSSIVFPPYTGFVEKLISFLVKKG
ncbi:aldehyde dehydrogenase family protein [Arsenicibacter rosenii]|uniref:Aldehyde dehydrogenase n=1 Tax=Arsenicibacter rosenii TaxID=1750698 RepID=A0A1S2VP69_9BACT|nr:aldehyde dehydrogenase family protein [Arsenicibacter rosenii]OIN60554.1 aldehyde dehydrogenase family protein [Arsenicibacter rosenii]